MKELFFDKNGFLVDNEGLKLSNKNYLILKYISQDKKTIKFKMDLFKEGKIFYHYLNNGDGIFLNNGEDIEIDIRYFSKFELFNKSLLFKYLEYNKNYILYSDDLGIHLFKYPEYSN